MAKAAASFDVDPVTVAAEDAPAIAGLRAALEGAGTSRPSRCSRSCCTAPRSSIAAPVAKRLPRCDPFPCTQNSQPRRLRTFSTCRVPI
jgi:hypothetical protein